MKKQLLCILLCVAVAQVASADKWESTTHECSLEFPDGLWTFQEGKDIEHGQIILSAAHREEKKTVSVLRYQVSPSISVRDPRFVQGVKGGFAKAGGRLLADGYTNVNGCITYWFTGEGYINGQKVSTLRYALCENGRLYQLVGECMGCSPLSDNELPAIFTSFQMHTKGSPSAADVRTDALAYRIGLITGCLLVVIPAAVFALRLILKRSKKQDQASGK